MTLDDEALTRLTQLAQAATPGPWEVEAAHPDNEMVIVATRDAESQGAPYICDSETEDDAAFIAEACNAVPVLVQQVRDAEEKAQCRLAFCPWHDAWQKAEARAVAAEARAAEVERERDELVTRGTGYEYDLLMRRVAELEAERDAIKAAPFRCLTHMCGSCGGCMAAKITDENTRLRESLDTLRAGVRALADEYHGAVKGLGDLPDRLRALLGEQPNI